MTQEILRRRGERFIMTTYATPKTGITYTVYPIYEQKERICGNCKWWNETKELPEFGYCQHPDMPAYVQGRLIDPVRNTFGCEPLFEAKESEGEGA